MKLFAVLAAFSLCLAATQASTTAAPDTTTDTEATDSKLAEITTEFIPVEDKNATEKTVPAKTSNTTVNTTVAIPANTTPATPAKTTTVAIPAVTTSPVEETSDDASGEGSGEIDLAGDGKKTPVLIDEFEDVPEETTTTTTTTTTTSTTTTEDPCNEAACPLLPGCIRRNPRVLGGPCCAECALFATCRVNNKEYQTGQEMPSPTACERCFCTTLGIMCAERTCHVIPNCALYERKTPWRCCPECRRYNSCKVGINTYGTGEKVPSGTDCLHCLCSDLGEVKCRATACANDYCAGTSVTIPGMCCPICRVENNFVAGDAATHE